MSFSIVLRHLADWGSGIYYSFPSWGLRMRGEFFLGYAWFMNDNIDNHPFFQEFISQLI